MSQLGNIKVRVRVEVIIRVGVIIRAKPSAPWVIIRAKPSSWYNRDLH